MVLGWYEGAKKVDLSDYVQSGTWDVVECPGKLENKRDPGEQQNRLAWNRVIIERTVGGVEGGVSRKWVVENRIRV